MLRQSQIKSQTMLRMPFHKGLKCPPRDFQLITLLHTLATDQVDIGVLVSPGLYWPVVSLRVP